jgi:hypothetical protein
MDARGITGTHPDTSDLGSRLDYRGELANPECTRRLAALLLAIVRREAAEREHQHEEGSDAA